MEHSPSTGEALQPSPALQRRTLTIADCKTGGGGGHSLLSREPPAVAEASSVTHGYFGVCFHTHVYACRS